MSELGMSFAAPGGWPLSMSVLGQHSPSLRQGLMETYTDIG